MAEIRMPKLSDSMEEGLILQWLIADGQPVNVGDELIEIETDKATITWEAQSAGVLSVVIPAGETVRVGDVIGQLGDATAAPTETPGPPPEAEAEPAAAVVVDAPPASGGGALATPVARRLAAEHGIVLRELRGTGPRGRITKADVLTAAGRPVPAQPAPPPAVAASNGDGTATELSRTQRLIARRMAEAKATIPHFQVQTEVAMDLALALREDLRGLADPLPSINDLIVRASALALRAHPRANGSYRGKRFELHERVNVGVAVAADDALIVPVVLDADAKSLREIAVQTRRLAARVRSGEITPPELSGATFTVSNLGMYGMTAITPVINPPQAAILGVGAARALLARDDQGAIVDRTLLTLTLSCDHRILYGADAAQFLAEIRRRLEAPLSLVV